MDWVFNECCQAKYKFYIGSDDIWQQRYLCHSSAKLVVEIHIYLREGSQRAKIPRDWDAFPLP